MCVMDAMSLFRQGESHAAHRASDKVLPDSGGASGESRFGSMRAGLLGVCAWQVLGALVQECEFEGGFKSHDAFVQILNAELLFGHCGVELLHFI